MDTEETGIYFNEHTSSGRILGEHSLGVWLTEFKSRLSDFPGGPVVKNCLSAQGTQIWSLGGEDPTCRRATKSMGLNSWACTLEPVLHNERSQWNEKSVTLNHPFRAGWHNLTEIEFLCICGLTPSAWGINSTKAGLVCVCFLQGPQPLE